MKTQTRNRYAIEVILSAGCYELRTELESERV